MKPRMLLVTLAAVVASGCATQPPTIARPDQECKGKCQIEVESTGDIVPRKVFVTGGAGEEIRWKIRPWFVHFTDVDGIQFDDRDGGTSVFTRCGRDGWREFVCINSGKTGEYKYTVRLLGSTPFDPWVVNR